MKRLYSYWTYPFTILPLFIDGLAMNWLFGNKYTIDYKLILLASLLNVVFILGFYINITKLKRIHIQGADVYIYDLYSNVPYIIDVHYIRDVERDNSRYATLWGIYDIILMFEGEEHKFSFMKNKSIWNVRKYFFDL